MAKPQKENGYTGIANEILECLAATSFPARWYRVLFAVFRKSYGFHEKVAHFKKGELHRMTGMDRRHLKVVLDAMKQALVITLYITGHEISITFNKDYESWCNVIRTGDEANVIRTGDATSSVEMTKRHPSGRRSQSFTYYMKDKRKKKGNAFQAKKTKNRPPYPGNDEPNYNWLQCPNPDCGMRASNIEKGGKCPYCGKWVT
jgi:phage replication O-like protein O